MIARKVTNDDAYRLTIYGIPTHLVEHFIKMLYLKKDLMQFQYNDHDCDNDIKRKESVYSKNLELVICSVKLLIIFSSLEIRCHISMFSCF